MVFDGVGTASADKVDCDLDLRTYDLYNVIGSSIYCRAGNE